MSESNQLSSDFLKDLKNRRTCILYEFLRNKNEEETLIEMAKTGFEVEDEDVRKEVYLLFRRFKRGRLGVEMETLEKLLEMEPAESLNDLVPKEFDFKDKSCFFRTQLKRLPKAKIIKEIEIYANADFPVGVMIGIHQNDSRECVYYHKCNNGVVVRYLRNIKHLVSNNLNYQDVALDDVYNFLNEWMQQRESIEFLKIRADYMEAEFYKKLDSKFRELLKDKNFVRKLNVGNLHSKFTTCLDMASIFKCEEMRIEMNALKEDASEYLKQLFEKNELKTKLFTISTSQKISESMKDKYKNVIGDEVGDFLVKYEENEIVFTKKEMKPSTSKQSTSGSSCGGCFSKQTDSGPSSPK